MESISGNNLIDVQVNASSNIKNSNTPFVTMKQPVENVSTASRFSNNHNPNNNNSMTYNKFGTISGYNASNISTNPNQRASILTKSNTNYFNGNANAIQNQVAPINGANCVVGSSAALTSDAQTLANNRLRAINRSFRTAVDKSFDIPCHSGKRLLLIFLMPFISYLLSIKQNFCLTKLIKL